jgi:hypothetical protein
MTSARDRADAGLPTALAAGNYIAIGTSHGFVLVFDGGQTLKYSLGGPSYGRECGSVSCLAFDSNIDEGPTRLLVGFAKGHFTLGKYSSYFFYSNNVLFLYSWKGGNGFSS